eukprot:scaffold177522_cov20-Tisochrysis_lutea.AAC.1
MDRLDVHSERRRLEGLDAHVTRNKRLTTLWCRRLIKKGVWPEALPLNGASNLLIDLSKNMLELLGKRVSVARRECPMISCCGAESKGSGLLAGA